MKTLSLFCLILSNLLLLACETELLPEKPLFDKDELLLHLSESPEFQEYLAENVAQTETIIQKKREISEREFEFIKNLHQSYPLWEDFRSAADANLYETYKKLTAIDLLAKNTPLQKKFEIFLSKLQEEVRYEPSDLWDVIFQLESGTYQETEKTILGCSTWCMVAAAQERQTVFSRCMQPLGGLSEPESYCWAEARLAFDYYLRGCLSGCSQQE